MVYTYKEWLAMNCTENAEKANEILEEKISELLEKNGYKNDYGPGMFHISDLNHDVTVKPIGGTIAEVKIKKLNYYSDFILDKSRTDEEIAEFMRDVNKTARKEYMTNLDPNVMFFVGGK